MLLNSRLLWGGLALLLRVGGGMLTLPLALQILSREAMGLWYLYLGFGALASRLDFGLGPTASRGFSYLLAGSQGLTATAKSGVADAARIGEFIASVKFALNLVVGLLLLLFTGCCLLLMWRPPVGVPASTVWLSAVIYGTALVGNALGAGRLALISGAHLVAEAQRIGVVSGVVGIAVTLGGLVLGLELVGLALGACAAGLVQLAWGEVILRRILQRHASPGSRWAQECLIELWPQWWRTGVVSFGAFLIYYANTFVVASSLGLAETASWGLSYQVAMLVVTIGYMPLTLVQPNLATAWAEQAPAKAWAQFYRNHALGLGLASASSLGILLFGPELLAWMGSHTVLIPARELLVLLVIALLEVNHIGYAMLVLSRGEVPFYWLALGSGCAVLGLAVVVVPVLGLWGALLAQGLVQLLGNNWYPLWYAYRWIPSSRRVAP